MPLTRLLLVSKFAFYPPHWQAFSALCRRYDVRGAVLADTPPELPSVHRQLGWMDAGRARCEPFGPDVRQVPAGSRRQRRRWLRRQLDELAADAIWLQQEPHEEWTLEVLRRYRRQRGPRIVSAVCENIFRRDSFWRRLRRRRAWARLDGLLATASASLEGVRQAGMPSRIPAQTLVAGMEGPPRNVPPMVLPWVRGKRDWVIGYAGRICPEKGWKVLLEAVRSLPPHYKVALAGDGPQMEQLAEWAGTDGLRGRVFPAGVLPKAQLWQFYRAVDCLVLPSLTFPRWKEQFGGVLADAMAMGLPIVGSDSGAIPEVVGPAGLITPEGRVPLLATALRRLHEEPQLAAKLAAAGLQRFHQEFSIPAYADKIAAALQLPVKAEVDRSVAEAA